VAVSGFHKARPAPVSTQTGKRLASVTKIFSRELTK